MSPMLDRDALLEEALPIARAVLEATRPLTASDITTAPLSLPALTESRRERIWPW